MLTTLLIFRFHAQHTQGMILQPQGIHGGTFRRKFLGAEFPEIVPDHIGGFLGLHDPII
jgi:hypothetical protein